MAPKRKTQEGEEGGGSSENKRVTRQMVASTRRVTRSASLAAGSPKLLSLPMTGTSPKKKAKTMTSQNGSVEEKSEEDVKGKAKEVASEKVEAKEEAREKVKGKGKAKMEEDASEEVEVKEEAREKVKGKGEAKMEEEASKEVEDKEEEARKKGKAKVEEASEEVEVKEEAREKVEGKGEEKVEEDAEKDENLNKTIIIERCTQCNSFKTRALEVKVGLEDAVPGINVVVNPNKPRRGCFEIREDGGETFISLQEMKRPFKPMKDLDMQKVVSDIVEKIK